MSENLEGFQVQTRTDDGALKYFPTVALAMAYTKRNNDVWKVSFSVGSGERIRLVRRVAGGVWYYEPMSVFSEEFKPDIEQFARDISIANKRQNQ